MDSNEVRYGGIGDLSVSFLSKAKSGYSGIKNSFNGGWKTLKNSLSRSKEDSTSFIDDEDISLNITDFENSNNLEDLRRCYQDKGLELDSFSEIYEEAREDWWNLKKDYEEESFEDLPHDSYNLKKDSDLSSVELNVVGISHGQKYFSKMSDEVKEYLIDEIDSLSRDNRVYLEDGMNEDIFENFFDRYRYVEELDDRKIIGLNKDEYNDSKTVDYLSKYFAGPIIDAVQNLSRRGAKPEKSKEVLREVSLEALEDPEKISELQKHAKAYQLPWRFREDYYENKKMETNKRKRYIENKIEEEESYEPKGLLDRLKNWYDLRVLELGRETIKKRMLYEDFRENIGWKRSKYMVNEALRRGSSNPQSIEGKEGSIWLFTGALHQADIEQYLERNNYRLSINEEITPSEEW